uniref:FHF complex subunit HOOK-interacting protein C-terminal domain-containing protein n=1 Tax=Astatotilapia calliptera TaxID=8154 RepID=A0AAX7UTR1_ASTCA
FDSPTVELFDSFVDHWKSITNYYIDTTDDSRPVRQTDIPWHLRQMLDILVYEEKQQAVEDTGACMEYLLQHKLLETLCTLGKAQYPPGMSQQVLLFFSKLLSQVQKPLLQLVNVYRPVQKLICLCALPGSQTEKEEAQFLLVVCSRVKQDPHTLRYVLQVTSEGLRSTSSETSARSTVSSDQSQSAAATLCVALMTERFITVPSQSTSVCLKAHESLLLLCGLQAGFSGELLSTHTQLGELLAVRLQDLYSLLPMEDSFIIHRHPPHRKWGSYQILGVCLCVFRCEQVVLGSTSVLCATVRLVQSSSLLDQLVHFLLRSDAAQPLLRRCDHISDQISMVSLCLVEELLQKPHRDVLDVLVLSFLHTQSYLSPPASAQEERQTESGEDSEDPEDDPFFSDSLTFSDSPHPPPPPPPGPQTADDVINSFLCLVPVQVRSSQLLQEGGYETYVHDAHTLVTECQALSLSWDWPLTPPPLSLSSGKDSASFFEGHLLKVLFDRLGRLLEQPYELNLQLTAVLSRLSAFSHPLLHEYLLNPYIHLSQSSRSLFSVLIRVMGELMQRIQQVSNLNERLLNTRRALLGLPHDPGLDHLTLLKGVIVLEEFCKELAAIAFVKLPQDQD